MSLPDAEGLEGEPPPFPSSPGGPHAPSGSYVPADPATQSSASTGPKFKISSSTVQGQRSDSSAGASCTVNEPGIGSMFVEGAMKSCRAFSEEEDLHPGLGKHRDYYWVRTEVGCEGQKLEPQDVAAMHGVPEHVVFNHVREELHEEEAVRSLPFALLLVVLYALMCFSHDTQATTRAVEEAISFDISNNANFAFSTPGNMGFKVYTDVNSFADFWSWMNKGMTGVYFIGDRPTSEPFIGDEKLNLGKYPEEEALFYLWHNRKIGPMRLLQEVAPAAQCQNDKMRTTYALNCSIEPQLDLTLDPVNFDVALVHYVQERSVVVWLENQTYGQQIRDLEVEGWLNKRTYRMQVSFLSYNAIMDLLTMTNVHFFFARSGHIWKTITHRTFKLAPYEEWGSLLFEILFYAQITIIFLTEMREVIRELIRCRFKLSAFMKAYVGFWNAVDWISIIMAYTMLGVWLNRYSHIKELERNVLDLPELLAVCYEAGGEGKPCAERHYAELYEHVQIAGQYNEESNLIGAFYPVCIMLRLFKAFQVQPRLALVSMTLYNSSGDLAHFGIVFVAAFLSFTVMSVALFGRDLSEFADFGRAVMTLFRALVGDFSYDAMAANNRAVAFAFMAIFQIAMFLVMLNMLVAIVMDVYAETKNSLLRSETLWAECYEIVDRAVQNYRGQRLPFRRLLDCYVKARGEAALESTKVITKEDLLSLVPALPAHQAENIMVRACEDWSSTHHKPVQLPEVLNAASVAVEWAREVAEMLPGRGASSTQLGTAYSDGGESFGTGGPAKAVDSGDAVEKPLTAEQLANDENLPLEELFRAALLRLELEHPAGPNNVGQVGALRRVLGSLQLLATDAEPPASKSAGAGLRGLGATV